MYNKRGHRRRRWDCGDVRGLIDASQLNRSPTGILKSPQRSAALARLPASGAGSANYSQPIISIAECPNNCRGYTHYTANVLIARGGVHTFCRINRCAYKSQGPPDGKGWRHLARGIATCDAQWRRPHTSAHYVGVIRRLRIVSQ